MFRADRRLLVVGIFLAALALVAAAQAQAPGKIIACLSGIDEAWTFRPGPQ
jgi:hypothetical protein